MVDFNTKSETDYAWCAGYFEANGDVHHGAVLHAKLSGDLNTLRVFQSIVMVGKINETYGKYAILFTQEDVLTMWPLIRPYMSYKR